MPWNRATEVAITVTLLSLGIWIAVASVLADARVQHFLAVVRHVG